MAGCPLLTPASPSWSLLLGPSLPGGFPCAVVGTLPPPPLPTASPWLSACPPHTGVSQLALGPGLSAERQTTPKHLRLNIFKAEISISAPKHLTLSLPSLQMVPPSTCSGQKSKSPSFTPLTPKMSPVPDLPHLLSDSSSCCLPNSAYLSPPPDPRPPAP